MSEWRCDHSKGETELCTYKTFVDEVMMLLVERKDCGWFADAV